MGAFVPTYSWKDAPKEGGRLGRLGIAKIC